MVMLPRDMKIYFSGKKHFKVILDANFDWRRDLLGTYSDGKTSIRLFGITNRGVRLLPA
jgi:hypothetical protein